MKDNYVIWSTKNEVGACVLDELHGIDKVIKLKKGYPQLENFSSAVAFDMDQNYPTDTVLVDNIGNTSMLIVVSPQLKGFLESRNLRSVEYLPVTINNHKGRTASDDYYIIHPIDPVDCLDIERSGAKMGLIAKMEVRSVESIILDSTRVDSERELFKPKFFYRVTLVTKELAESIDSAGFTGVRWLEMKDYPEV